MSKFFKYKNWKVIYTPNEGARIDRLQYSGVDLLTAEPTSFSPPIADYGAYETRPVYGYDDCFPSVAECRYPESSWIVPDHGEVCWLPWEVTEKQNGLLFSVQSKELPLLLKRELVFNQNTLTWLFEVYNQGSETLPFQHVTHPLFPLKDVKDIQFPQFSKVFDDINKVNLEIKTPEELEKYLLNKPKGTANMLFLQGAQEGRLSIGFRAGITLKMSFPKKLFPSVGIWWNNYGYPDEEGIRRNECAFEPVPGSNSSLEDAYKEGSCLQIAPNQKFKWSINWLFENY